tara:strand:+ start:544 stop:693 length:150 start_codon:yes stop_codon:yes gene_type:complete
VYDPVSQHVFEQIDGGANGYDRVNNRKKRVETNVESIIKNIISRMVEKI